MKSIKKVMVGMLLFGFMTMNFILGYFSNPSDNSISLQNLKALQASATEAWCDQTNEQECTITVHGENGGIFTGTSKGLYRISN